ncbi:DUF2634 domain-containing protein [Paenibacillus sp. LX16]|uniref:DUF2634 domain-containing protein n=1 Tax=Paenibacillus sp. LX16 TaxID=1740264 RepID=UPI002E2944CE|nr:DUF2634 domain-containing protein [Paenibacillus sp. LX16]
MIPTGAALTEEHITEQQQPSYTYQVDFANKRISDHVDGLEAVKQAVILILSTDRFQYFIYTVDYGMERIPIVGASQAIVRSELQRCVTEALLQDDRISGVINFRLSFNGDEVLATFTVVTEFGNFEQEATFNNVR